MSNFVSIHVSAYCYTDRLLMTNFLLFAVLAVLGLLAWKVLLKRPEGSEVDRIHRELLENLRHELLDTKDKLHDGMGRNAESIQQRLEKTLGFVNTQLTGMDDRIDKRVMQINERLDAAARLMTQVSKQYGTVEELSSSIKRLQEAFRAPKPRGGFGEKALLDLVAQVIPGKTYEAQHTFRDGVIVDLLIRTANGDIAIDAKFPLENYLRLVESPESEELRKAFRNDVKKHIKDVAKKYILPDEGTLEFALLYVPSDAIMYEILTDVELGDIAESLHIFVLSPHSFYYFLTVIYAAYQSQQFEENAKQVLGLLRGIQQQSGKLGTELKVLQGHIGNAATKMGDVQANYGKLDMQVAQAGRLGLAKGEATSPLVEQPGILEGEREAVKVA